MITPISEWTCPLLCLDGMGTRGSPRPIGLIAHKLSSEAAGNVPGNVLYVDVIESPFEFRRSSRVGARRSLHVTALGKALAAFPPAEARVNILSTMTFQPATPRTIINLMQFRQELGKIRQQGYAVDNEEAVLRARYVSAPILNSDGEAIATVSNSGPVTRVSPDQVPALAGAITSAAHAISPAMGFSGRDSEIATPAAPRGSSQLV